MRPRNGRGAKVNLCGRLTPRETAAVLEHAEVFLGPDSGPMHLAASVGVPCVIAFSAQGFRVCGIRRESSTRSFIIRRSASAAGLRPVSWSRRSVFVR